MPKFGYPFGLIDCQLFVLNASEVAGAAVPIPAGRVLEVTPTQDEVTLEGYNATVARDVSGVGADVSLEYGGISLDVLAAVSGATVVLTGTTPSQVWRLVQGSAAVSPPYVRIIGKALEGTGDWWMDLEKVRFNMPAGSFTQGEFYITTLEGGAVRNAAGILYEFFAHETAAPITAVP